MVASDDRQDWRYGDTAFTRVYPVEWPDIELAVRIWSTAVRADDGHANGRRNESKLSKLSKLSKRSNLSKAAEAGDQPDA